MLAEKDLCTGCQACVNACPKSALTMKEDRLGSFFPEVDSEKCVSCGLCEKSCPIIHEQEIPSSDTDVFAVVSKEDQNLSSSGGAFSVFARYVLQKNGIVYGAAMGEDLQVRHISAESLDELKKLRGSKYVHSFVGDSYKSVKENLKKGRLVLFSGTPCQVAGLYSYLGKNRYEDLLITLDLVCHGVPSQAFFNAYIKKLEKEVCKSENKHIASYRFRKLDAWDYRPSYLLNGNKSWHAVRLEKNAYMAAFFKGLSYRENCFQCKFANLNRVGTFTIADFWGIGTHGIPFKHGIGSGVSAVIDNQKKMDLLMADLQQFSYIEKRSMKEVVFDNSSLKGAVQKPEQREHAIADMLNPDLSLLEFAKKYRLIPRNKVKYWAQEIFKTVVYSLGLYNIYKAIAYRLK